MDFFNLQFNQLFLRKHGQKKYDIIIDEIKKENSDIVSYNIDDLEIVFKISLLDFFELDENVMENIIKDIFPYKKIDIKEIKSRHKNSIIKIKKYLYKTIKSLK